MKREYKGRSFTPVGARAVPIGPLPYDLYIYLPLNARMLKIRAKGQEAEIAVLLSYQRRGHDNFYFVEGEGNSAVPEQSAAGAAGAAESPAAAVAGGPLGSILPSSHSATSAEGALLEKSGSEAGELGAAGEKSAKEFELGEIQKRAAAGSEKGEKTTEEASMLPAAANEPGAESGAAIESSVALESSPSAESISPAEALAPSESGMDGSVTAGAESAPEASGAEAAAGSEETKESSAESGSAAAAEAAPAAELKLEEWDPSALGMGGSAAASDSVSAANAADPALNLALGAAEDEARKISAAAAEKEAAEKISADAGEAEAESGFAADGGIAEAEQEFAGDEAGVEAEQSFNPDQAEAEIMAMVKAQSEPEDDSSRKVAAEIDEIQEDLRSFAADQEEFVEDVQRIESGEEKALAGDWALAEDSPQLKGLSKEEKAGAKLAFALGKKLGQLRGELNAASRTPTKSPEEEAELASRKEALGQQIKKLEATSMILESLDDKDIEVQSPELAGKGKVELLGQLEAALGEIEGSALLNEDDARAISKKIKRVKAEDFGVHGEKVDELRETLAQRRAKADLGAPIEKVARKAINKMVAREVRAAKVGAVAARELAKQRQELSELLNQPASSPEESAELETRARKLQERIAGLESLSVAVEAGEEVPDAVLQAFALEEDPGFELEEGENEAEGLLRIENKLKALKAEVVEAKLGAADAQRELITRINGEEPKSAAAAEAEAAWEDAPDMPALSRLEHVERVKGELAQCAEELGAGAELDEQSLGEIYGGAAKAAREAAVLQQVDAKVVEKRSALRQLLRQTGGTPEQRAAIEQQALNAMEEISNLEGLQEELAEGVAVDPARLTEFVAKEIPAFQALPGETPKAALERMAKELGAARQKAQASGKKSEAAAEELLQAISASEHTTLKVKALKAKPLAVEEKRLSRMLKSFVETGKGADPNEIWEVNKSVAANARLAQAEKNVARKITGLAEEIKALTLKKGGTIDEMAARREKMDSLQREVWELRKLGDSIEAGMPDFRKIGPFLEEVPDALVLKGDKPTAENMASVIKGIGALRDELVFFKGDALKALDECTVIARGLTPEGAEENMARLVSGEDGRQVQAGVYAATFFRSFGYEDPELEFDLMKALFLAPYSNSEVAAAFPGRVALIHAAKDGGGDEMLLQDMAEAVRLSRAYLQIPGVITGKVSVDPTILKNYIAGPEGAKLDSDLLARLRQNAEAELSAGERVRLSDLAAAARAEISKANLSDLAT